MSNRRYHLHKRREIINFADVNHLSKKFSIILSMALLLDTAVNEQFDFLFNSILLMAVGICIASVVLFIQMMQKQKELEKFGYRKNTPTPVVWYIVYFILLFSFIFSFVSLLMVIIQKKRIEHIIKLFYDNSKQ